MPLAGVYEPSTNEWVRKQVEEYELSNGAKANDLYGKPVVILTSRGRKSGRLRKTPLMRVECDGAYAILASQGGAPTHPSWYRNIQEDCVVELRDQDEVRDYIAREVTGHERQLWWSRAVEVFPAYEEYRKATTREIPVLVLESERKVGLL